MAQSFTMMVGTVGGGLNVSADGGETWTHIGTGGRLPPAECDVRALTVYPNNPARVLAGTDAGVGFRRDRLSPDRLPADSQRLIPQVVSTQRMDAPGPGP